MKEKLVRGPRFWMTSGFRLITSPPEPVLPGRKKKKKKTKFSRMKGEHESPKKKKKQVEKLGRRGRIIHCLKYGGKGHNAAGCKIHPKKKMKKTQEPIEEAVSSSNGGGGGHNVIDTTDTIKL